MRNSALIGLSMVTLAIACDDGAVPNRDGNYSNVGQVGPGADPGPSSGGTSGGTTSGGTTSGGTTSGGTSSGDPNGPGFDIMATDMSGELYDNKTSTIMVVPRNGFNGPVNLTLEGTGNDIVGTFAKTTLNANETTMLTARSAKGGAVQFMVKGTSGTMSATRPVTFTASKILTLRLKAGADATPNAPDLWGSADSRFTVSAAAPLEVRFLNSDTVAHIMHTGGGAAFPHGNTNVPVAPNATDPAARTVNAGQTQTFYLHDKGGAGNSTNGSITVMN